MVSNGGKVVEIDGHLVMIGAVDALEGSQGTVIKLFGFLELALSVE